MKLVSVILSFLIFLFVVMVPAHAVTITPEPVSSGDNFDINVSVLYDVSREPVENANVSFIVNATGPQDIVNATPQDILTYMGNGIYCSGGDCATSSSDPVAPQCESEICKGPPFDGGALIPNYTVCVNASAEGFGEACNCTPLEVQCSYNLTLIPSSNSSTGMDYTFDIRAEDSSTCPGDINGDINYTVEKSVLFGGEDAFCGSIELLDVDEDSSNITVPNGGSTSFRLKVTLAKDGVCAVNLGVLDPRGEVATEPNGTYTLGHCETPQIFGLKYSGNRVYLDLSAFTCYKEGGMLNLTCSVIPNQTAPPLSNFSYTRPPGYITERIVINQDSGYNQTLISEGEYTCGPTLPSDNDKNIYNHTGDTTLNCTAYNTTNATIKTEENRTFRILDFDLSSIGISATVGIPFVLPVKVTNRGLFTDYYGITVEPSSGNILVERGLGLKQTGNLIMNEMQTVPFRTIALITGQSGSWICISTTGTTSNEPIGSTFAERHFKVEVNAKEASLPEFGWSGLLQIMLLATVIILLL